MAKKYRPGGIKGRKVGKAGTRFLAGLIYIGASAIFSSPKGSSSRKRTSSYGRSTRSVSQYEISLRRAEREKIKAERERIKAERERERAAKFQAKQEEQKQIEEELIDIDVENDSWINVHQLIERIVNIDDVNKLLSQYDYEQQSDITDGLFEKEYPSETEARKIAQLEADENYQVKYIQDRLDKNKKESSLLHFNIPEPTKESVRIELIKEAKHKIKAFLPWKQSKLRKEFVAKMLVPRYDDQFMEWSIKRNAYLSLKGKYADAINILQKNLDDLIIQRENFIKSRTLELFDQEIKKWENDRNVFYDSLRTCTQNIIDGDSDYVIYAITNVVQDDELPMEYFVDFVYNDEKGKVMVDLDLPELEDIPTRKIVKTPSGKKSIRPKNQTDLKSDYVSCVFGLAMYVAHLIFNVSLKIQEIEIMGFTQRQSANYAVTEDQYVFVVNFTRELFSSINFDRLSSFQIMNLFKHYFDMTKNCDLKQINLSKAFDKMEECIPINYQTYISSLPPVDIEKGIPQHSQASLLHVEKVVSSAQTSATSIITRELTRDIPGNLIRNKVCDFN